MNYYNFKIVLQEVPGEISLCFSITGCSLNCQGCHSPFTWKKNSGSNLTVLWFKKQLEKYRSMATCVLFMGGEWHENQLIKLLKIAKESNYKTCLYSGENEISKNILQELTWVKTGAWIQALGGLENQTTNQQFKEVKTNKILNSLFIKKQNT